MKRLYSLLILVAILCVAVPGCGVANEEVSDISDIYLEDSTTEAEVTILESTEAESSKAIDNDERLIVTYRDIDGGEDLKTALLQDPSFEWFVKTWVKYAAEYSAGDAQTMLGYIVDYYSPMWDVKELFPDLPEIDNTTKSYILEDDVHWFAVNMYHISSSEYKKFKKDQSDLWESSGYEMGFHDDRYEFPAAGIQGLKYSAIAGISDAQKTGQELDIRLYCRDFTSAEPYEPDQWGLPKEDISEDRISYIEIIAEPVDINGKPYWTLYSVKFTKSDAAGKKTIHETPDPEATEFVTSAYNEELTATIPEPIYYDTTDPEALKNALTNDETFSKFLVSLPYVRQYEPDDAFRLLQFILNSGPGYYRFNDFFHDYNYNGRYFLERDFYWFVTNIYHVSESEYESFRDWCYETRYEEDGKLGAGYKDGMFAHVLAGGPGISDERYCGIDSVEPFEDCLKVVIYGYREGQDQTKLTHPWGTPKEEIDEVAYTTIVVQKVNIMGEDTWTLYSLSRSQE